MTLAQIIYTVIGFFYVSIASWLQDSRRAHLACLCTAIGISCLQPLIKVIHDWILK